MSAPIQLYQHLVEKFRNYSTEELIVLNNDIVKNNGWGSSKGTFRTALLYALAKRGIDLSRIISKEDGFTSVVLAPVRLDDNVLVPLH